VEVWGAEADFADPYIAERKFLYFKARHIFLARRALTIARGLESASPDMDQLEAVEARVNELLELHFDRTGADALVEEDPFADNFGQILVEGGDVERWQRLAFWPAGQVNDMMYVDFDAVVDLSDKCQASRRELERRAGASIDDALSWLRHVEALKPGGIVFGSARHR